MQLWTLYLLALLFGILSGFFIPASSAMMPLLVRPEELTVSNSIYQGKAMLSGFIGPVLAGGLIALFARLAIATGSVELTGIAAAMAFDAFTFMVSVLTLFLMYWEGIVKPQASAPGNFIGSIRQEVA
jgi:MFS family permease